MKLPYVNDHILILRSSSEIVVPFVGNLDTKLLQVDDFQTYVIKQTSVLFTYVGRLVFETLIFINILLFPAC